MFRLSYFFFLFLLPVSLIGRTVNLAERKELRASFTNTPIIIDGRLDEAIWKNAAKATDFVQYEPQPGAPSKYRTEVTILYDNSAVYIGAMLYDDHPDSILKQLAARDDYSNNNDYFGVQFDTYHDEQNATTFIVTAAGVQADGITRFNSTDLSWNAAWYSKVAINEKGWCIEIKIPYSALRFPKKKIQEWGINFERYVRRTREDANWNKVVPQESNILNQAGVLTGIHDIESPIRLALFPYVSAYTENYQGTNANSFNGGLDLKYGINESFTVDMTLIPDFGQTLYDNKVLNLSPVEVRYDERRYFFTEGLSLFNKNDLFYTRRVGGTPAFYDSVSNLLKTNEVITDNPSVTKLYNAIKISGRTKSNLGIGFFNGISAQTTATIKDTITNKERQIVTSPFTNYNVIVLDQALKNNSYVSFINTNVSRSQRFYNADVSAFLFKLVNNSGKYCFDGSGDVSQLFNNNSNDVGYRYYLDFSKISGNHTFSVNTKTISDLFNPNDLGYLSKNNLTYYSFWESYNVYKPFLIFNASYNSYGISYYRIYNPNIFNQFFFFGNHNFTMKNYISWGLFWNVSPVVSNDYYEPRTTGRFYRYPVNFAPGGYVSSDYRKKFTVDLNFYNTWFESKQRNSFYLGYSSRYRFSDKFSLTYSWSGQYNTKDVGYVDKINDSIYFGVRNLYTITNSLFGSYIFTNTMSLTLNARHYWSQAKYDHYNLLGTDGNLYPTNYNSDQNINFNSFNVYLSYVWQYLPGSEMSIVFQNSIYSSGQELYTNYSNDLNSTLAAPQSNSLSIKIIYYLDYLDVEKRVRKWKMTDKS